MLENITGSAPSVHSSAPAADQSASPSTSPTSPFTDIRLRGRFENGAFVPETSGNRAEGSAF